MSSRCILRAHFFMHHNAMKKSKTSSRPPCPIYLIGYMGCGKTTIGRLLAESLSWDFVDTDASIAAAEQRSIAQIFDEAGEAYFRQAEADLIRQPAMQQSTIIATGGGLPCHHDNMTYLLQHGTVVYLKVGIDKLCQRLSADQSRPLLPAGQDTSLRKHIQQHLGQRRPTYRRAHITVMAHDEPRDVVRRIRQKLSHRSRK